MCITLDSTGYDTSTKLSWMPILGHTPDVLSHKLWDESRMCTFKQEIPVLTDMWDPPA